MTTTEAERNQQAWRAIQQFNKMRPTLQSFVRKLTGNNKIVVKPTSGGPMSTADEILVTVPIEMGQHVTHIREVCYDRDAATGWRLCPACDMMDSIMFHTYHETGHALVGGTHDRLAHSQRNILAASVWRAWKDNFPKFAKAKSNHLESDFTISYAMNAAAATHKWLTLVFNVTEDLRVDTKMFKVRPGVRDMAYADMMKVLLKGIPNGDVVRFWKDADEDTQLMIAFMSKGLDYPLEYFSDSVQEFLDTDPMIDEFIRDALSADTKEESWDVACRLLAYMHSLDRCDPPNEDEESDEEEDSDDSGGKSSESGDSEGGGDSEAAESSDSSDPSSAGSGGSNREEGGEDSSSDESEPGDDTSQRGRGDIGDEGDSSEDDDDSGEEGSDRSTDGQPSPEIANVCDHSAGDPSDKSYVQVEVEKDAVEKAIMQAMVFDGPSVEVVTVRMHEFGKPIPGVPHHRSGWSDESYYSFRPKTVDASVVGPASMRAKRVFTENSITKRSRNDTKGKIVGNSLAKRVPFDDPRIFGNRTRPKKKSYEVVILADISGSNYFGSRIENVKATLAMMSTLMSKVDVDFSVYAHTAHWYDRTHTSLALDVYPIKKKNERWGKNIKARVDRLTYSESNLDGHALEFGRKLLDRSDATDRILFYVTDGAMPAANHDEELEILQREIKIFKRKGYVLIGVGIDTDSPTQHGLETVQIDQPSDVANVISLLEKKLTVG